MDEKQPTESIRDYTLENYTLGKKPDTPAWDTNEKIIAFRARMIANMQTPGLRHSHQAPQALAAKRRAKSSQV